MGKTLMKSQKEKQTSPSNKVAMKKKKRKTAIDKKVKGTKNKSKVVKKAKLDQRKVKKQTKKSPKATKAAKRKVQNVKQRKNVDQPEKSSAEDEKKDESGSSNDAKRKSIHESTEPEKKRHNSGSVEPPTKQNLTSGGPQSNSDETPSRANDVEHHVKKLLDKMKPKAVKQGKPKEVKTEGFEDENRLLSVVSLSDEENDNVLRNREHLEKIRGTRFKKAKKKTLQASSSYDS